MNASVTKILDAQINIERFKSIDSIEERRNILSIAYKNHINSKNIFQGILSKPMDSEMIMQLSVDGYAASLELINDRNTLINEFEKLMTERAEFLESSQQQLAKQWGL